MSPMTSRPLSIELGLLGYLHDGPLHGYQIYQSLREVDGLGQVWRIKQAQLYALLSKLEGAGYLQSRLQAQEVRPTRRIYQLTARGEATYESWLLSPVNTPRQMRQEFMVKLFFAKREGQQKASALIDNQLAVCRHWLEKHQEQGASSPAESFNQAVQQYRLGQIQAHLTWLEQIKPDEQ